MPNLDALLGHDMSPNIGRASGVRAKRQETSDAAGPKQKSGGNVRLLTPTLRKSFSNAPPPPQKDGCLHRSKLLTPSDEAGYRLKSRELSSPRPPTYIFSPRNKQDLQTTRHRQLLGPTPSHVPAKIASYPESISPRTNPRWSDLSTDALRVPTGQKKHPSVPYLVSLRKRA